MENKRILIIHGWESNSREHWFLEEKQRLEKIGHKVTVPDMPDTFCPKKDEWVKVIKEFTPNDDTILVGHSLGGVAILRYLEETDKTIPKCILIATPIKILTDLNYDLKPMNNFFETEFNWDKIKQNCKEFIIMNQTKDEWVPLQHGKDLAGYVGAKLKVVEGSNHFDTINFNLLEKYILII